MLNIDLLKKEYIKITRKEIYALFRKLGVANHIGFSKYIKKGVHLYTIDNINNTINISDYLREKYPKCVIEKIIKPMIYKRYMWIPTITFIN